MIITFGGTPGSGKGTVSKRIAKLLRYERFDIGELRRDTARNLGMTLEEYNRLGERDSSTDRWVDSLQTRLGKRKKNLIVDGRLSFHFIPRSLKIFLYTSPDVAAARVWKDVRSSSVRNETRNVRSRADLERSIRRRIASDVRRYRRYYRVNPYKKTHYDLYLDTTKLTREQVFRRVRDFLVDKGVKFQKSRRGRATK